MSNRKKQSSYTIVYVYGPTRCKQSYFENKILNRENGEFVKIGKTDFDGKLAGCNEELLKKQAIARCSQESKTGISDWCDIYDTFIFPQVTGKNVDDVIRNLLCNDVYSLDNSKAETNKGDIKPGKEFVYGVSRNHIKHAVESYCFQLMIDTHEEEHLKEVQTICKINSIAMNDDEEEECSEPSATRKKRDINMILSPGDIVYLVDSRDKNAPVMENGVQVTAEFVGNKKFKYKDEEPMFASPLAIKLLNRIKNADYQTINGNYCWTVKREVNGRTVSKSLVALYDEAL